MTDMTLLDHAHAADGRGNRRVRFTVSPGVWRSAMQGSPDDGLADAVTRDLRHHYSAPLCAHRWLAVCADPAYGHETLIRRVAENVPSVVRRLRAEAGAEAEFAVVSLGPGDGSLDEQLLHALASERALHSYCGVDLSFELLCLALRRLVDSPRMPPALAIAAICGDFADGGRIATELPADDIPRLFTLLGFTLGNYDETVLLGSIRRLMRADDFLLVDGRLHHLGAITAAQATATGELARVLQSYDRETVRQFLFAPVELATRAQAVDVGFGYELTDVCTRVPGAVNILIHCTGLDTTIRLTGESVRRARLDLAVTTVYDKPSLTAWFPEAGFAPLWTHEMDGMTLFLLKPNG